MDRCSLFEYTTDFLKEKESENSWEGRIHRMENVIVGLRANLTEDIGSQMRQQIDQL